MMPQKYPDQLVFRSFPSLLIGLVFIYCLSHIFYIFPSGYPQPADAFIALAIGLGFMHYAAQHKLTFNLISASLIGFLIFAILVNLFHYITLKDSAFIKSSAYYVYNAGVFLLLTYLFSLKPSMMKKWMRIGLIIAVMIETIFLINIGSVDIREIGTFNNPNQLGYWALLVSASLFLLKDPNKRFSWFDYAILIILTLAALMSLSRGVIAGFPIIIALYIFSYQTKKIIRNLAIVTAVVLTIGLSTLIISNPDKVQQIAYIGPVIERFLKTGDLSHDNIEGRGYSRFSEHPHYLILGAGEGAYARFDPIHQLEFHSGFGNILFSYGVIGFILFLIFFYEILKNAPPRVWICMVPILFYSLTHQSFRFTLFWVFLAVCYQIKKEYQARQTYQL